MSVLLFRSLIPCCLLKLLPVALLLLALTSVPAQAETPASPPPHAGFFSTPELVKDIRAETAYSQTYTRLSRVGDRSLLYGHDLALGTALWISDDSPQGMHLLKVLNPKATYTAEATFWPMPEQGRTFFSADDAATGRSLWVTDGTEAGTRRLTGLLSKRNSGVEPRDVVPYGQGVRFWGNSDDASNLAELKEALWVSDGTPEGADILLTNDVSYTIQEVTGTPDGLYFFVVPRQGYTGPSELYAAQAGGHGFTRIKTFPANVPGAAEGVRILKAEGKRLYFSLHTAAHGWELWFTDGTEAGTRLLKDIQPGKNSSSPEFVATCGTRMLFTAATSAAGRELYATDGTPKGTVLLKSIGPGRQDSGVEVIAHGNDGRVYFRAFTTLPDIEKLWVTDGTPKGTALVPGNFERPWLMENHGSDSYFYAGGKFWVAGGAHAAPVQIPVPAETNTGYTTPSVTWETGFAFALYTNPSQTQSGIWISDGTAASVRKLDVLDTWLVGQRVVDLAKTDSRLIMGLSPAPGVSGENTTLLHDLTTGTTAQLPGIYKAYDSKQELGSGRVLLIKDDGNPARFQIWASDGTSAGTVLLGDQPSILTRGLEFRGGFAFYLLPDPAFGGKQTWWRTDGTPEGTVPLHHLPVVLEGSSPRYLKAGGGRIYFSADDRLQGQELWSSDGTAEGTTLVKDIVPGKESSFPILVGEYGGLMYFTAFTPETGRELWRTDGTAGGTFLLKDIRGGTSSTDNLPILAEAGGKVYFSAYDDLRGRELWVTDGTSAGTRIVADLVSGTKSSYPTELTDYQGRLAFRTDSSTIGMYRLWITDGTEAGTVRLRESTRYHTISSLNVLDGRLFWMHGAKLESSDGTPAGRKDEGGYPMPLSSLSVVLRPPVPGDAGAFSPGSPVLLIMSHENGLGRYSGSTGIEHIGPAGSKPILCGSRIVYTTVIRPGFGDNPPPNNNGLWSTNGHANAQIRLMEDGIDSILTTTGQRIFFLRTNERGTQDLESIRPDGTGRTLLVSADRGEAFNLVHVEQTRVFFTCGSWLWETDGTPGIIRRVPGGILPSPGYFSFARLHQDLYFPAVHPDAGRELHRITLPARPYLSLAGAGGDSDGPGSELGETGLIELPAQLLQQSGTRTLYLRNAGLTPLTDIAFSAPGLADFQITPASAASLAPGAVLTVQITFTPQVAGVRETEVQFSAQGAAGFTRSLRLHGRGLSTGDAAEIVKAPRSQLALAGQPVTFSAEFLAPDGVVSSGWQRSPGTALAETGPSLTLPAVQAEDAATYTFTAQTPAGSVTPGSADLGIIAPIPTEPYYVPENYALQIRCFATAPASSRLTYQWFFKNNPVISGNRIFGAQTPSLVIQGIQPEDAGDYECRVTMHAPDRTVTLSHGISPVKLLGPPNLAGGNLSYTFLIGQEVNQQIPLSYAMTDNAVRNLPPGLAISKTGLITGRPTKALPVDPVTGVARPYRTLFVAANAAGVGDPVEILIQILPIALPGIYDGVLARHPDLAGGGNLGGRVQLTIAPAGGFSGQLTHGGKVYRFAMPKLSQALPATYPPALEVGFDIPISLGKGQSVLTLNLKGDGYFLEASLKDPAGHQALGRMGSRRPAPYAEHGSYSVLLKPRPLQPGHPAPEPDSGPQIPSGHGSLVLTLAKNGTVTWKGKLADGTALTGSGSLIERDDIVLPMHHPLYQSSGSLHGELSLWRPPYLPPTTPPDITWFKAPEPSSSRGQVYKDGIFFHDLTAVGNQSFKPEKGWSFWGLPNTANNLRLTFTGEGLPEEGLTQTAGIDTAYRITVPRENTALKTLSINTTLRTFKGSFLIRPPAAKTPLSIPFEGVFTNEEAGGFFLIPEVAEDGTASLKTSRLHSGKIQITPIR